MKVCNERMDKGMTRAANEKEMVIVVKRVAGETRVGGRKKRAGKLR